MMKSTKALKKASKIERVKPLQVSNIMKTKHDTAKNSISNVR